MTKRMYLFAAAQLAAAVAIVYGLYLGRVQMVFTDEPSHMGLLIIATALIALVRTGIAIQRDESTEYLDYVSGWCIYMGMIATCVSFLILKEGIDVDALQNADTIGRVVMVLLAGFGTGFLGTLTGLVCALWLEMNRRLI